jgi:hypothetical protein
LSSIEIYVRHNGNGAVLNIYLDSSTKQELISALQSGRFESAGVPMHLELSVLPEWLTNQGESHARIPVAAINIAETD